jgi:hypothetical protein
MRLEGVHGALSDIRINPIQQDAKPMCETAKV